MQYSPFTVLVFMVIDKDETLLMLVFLVKRSIHWDYKFAESDRGSGTKSFLHSSSQLQQTSTAKYFINTSLNMLIKHVFLAALFMPSIMAALSQEEMTDTLIKVEKEEDLVQTFKKFEK